jgi:hypothetical protein
MKPWHIHLALDREHRARAFVKPDNFWQCLILLYRGWSPFFGYGTYWWSKPSKNLKRMLAR